MTWVVPVSGLLRLLLLCFVLYVPAVEGWAGGEAPLIAFAIPAQSLESAIHAFAEASGGQVLYETALTAGYRSHPVNGRFTAETALRMLLSGTPLRAKATADDAFTIVLPSVTENRGTSEHAGLSLNRHGHVLGIVQHDVLKILCRSSLTRPGSYRMGVQIWINGAGRVVGTALAAGSGRTDRDAAVLDALSRLTFSVSPPADMPQPLTMTILPLPSNKTGDCD